MATPLRGEAMAPGCHFHPPGRRTVMTAPWFRRGSSADISSHRTIAAQVALHSRPLRVWWQTPILILTPFRARQ